jgi:hypothetical protein
MTTTVSERNRMRSTHGARRSSSPDGIRRAYTIWLGMKGRCSRPSPKEQRIYKGVTVCGRWAESFEAFLEDMGEPPSPLHSIDRFPNQSGNYEPGNCRWATPLQQARNSRKNRLIAFRGESLCIAEWAERLGIAYHCLYARLRKGWTVERAMSE